MELEIRVTPLGQPTRTEFRTADPPLEIGRSVPDGICLNDDQVSRHHATVHVEPEGLFIEDRSTNGTRVGDRIVQGDSCPLGFGVPVAIGSHVLEFRLKARRRGSSTHSILSDTAGVSISSKDDAKLAIGEDLRREIHQRLISHIDLSDAGHQKLDDPSFRPQVLAALRAVVTELRDRLPVGVNESQLVGELADEALGLGPLETLLADPSVSEIMVVDPRTIYVERGGKIEHTDLRFTDEGRVRAALERIVAPLGRRIDESSPLVDARLADGSRVNAIIKPLALRGACITIRKFSKTPLSIPSLVELGALSKEMATFLERCVMAKKNIVVSGGTGSGKTTLLNALSSAIPKTERIVTIEDAAELRLQQPHVVALETRPPNLEGKGQYTMRDLVRNALRMRPDRIVVGECRGAEALDMLQAMNTGHDGSLTTTHANSPREAIARLETLTLMAGAGLPSRAIREQIASSIHLIVQQARFGDGTRRITAIDEVAPLDPDGEVVLRPLFHFTRTGTDLSGRVAGRFRATGYVPTFYPEFISRGLVRRGEAFFE